MKIPRDILIVLIGFAVLKLGIHLLSNGFLHYELFRDELYYLACSHHLAWGYVDQPPLSIYLLAAVRTVFGDSLFAVRLLPALLGAATVFLAGLMAFEMGGGKAAAVIACLGVLAAPVFLAMNTFYSMNAIDIFLWALAGYLVIRLIRENRPSFWIWLGVVIGLGLLNKISMLWFGFGLFVALLASRRKWLRTPWPYAAACIALALFLPYIVWNAANGFPHLEFMRNAMLSKYAGLTAGSFILGQFIDLNPVTALIWIPGLAFFLFTRDGAPFRSIGIIWVTVCTVLVVNGHSKPEYLAPACPFLFAGGGVLIERFSLRKNAAWLRAAVPGLAAVAGIISAPLAMPLLPVEKLSGYFTFIGISHPVNEDLEQGDLPQFFADMHGWENMARTVAEVYHGLPADEQAHAVVFTQNYGEAAAIDYYREKFGLPRACSFHNSYWFWGCDADAATVIVLGGIPAINAEVFGKIEEAAVIVSPHAMPYETNLPVYIGRDLYAPIPVIWRANKVFN